MEKVVWARKTTAKLPLGCYNSGYKHCALIKMDVDEYVKRTSSDSDSDYFPENSTTKSRARKKSKAIGVKKPKHEVCSNQCALSTLLIALPLELLVMIFQYIVQQYGPFLALKKYGLVSKKWRLALLENKLWQCVTLNCKEPWLKISQAFKWLCKFKYCAVKDLSVSSWRVTRTNTSFEQLLQLCHQLKCVQFNNCTLKFDEVFKCLDQVESLTIEQCNVKNFSVLVQTSKDTLRCLSLTGVGSSLVHNLSECDTPLLKLNTLQLLQLDNLWFFRPDCVKILQKMCPNLIHLQLCFPHDSVARVCESKVFPNGYLSLKYLELTFQTHCSLFESGHLCLLLAVSPNLQSLILIHYTQPSSLSYDKLVSLVPSNLKDLDLFYCKLDFNELLSKLLLCCHALQRLTIANPRGQRVSDDIITTIVASPCANTLRYLDLSGTDVTVNGIKILLNSVCNLKHLDLMRCRYLPRGTKHLYNNATDLDKLSKIVL